MCPLYTSVQLKRSKTDFHLDNSMYTVGKEILSSHITKDTIVESIMKIFQDTEILADSFPGGLKQKSHCYFKSFLLFTDSMLYLDVQTYVSKENAHKLPSPEQSLKSARLREVKHSSENPGASRETV